jgi:glycosyltransferase involved in cell wall biosynthesis
VTARRLVIVSDYDWPTGGVEEFVHQLVSQADGRYDCRVLSWSERIKLPDGFAGLCVVEHGDVREVWAELDEAELVVVASSFNVRMLARITADYVHARPVPTVTVVHTSGHSRDASSVGVQECWLRELAVASQRVVAPSIDVRTALSRLRDFPQEKIAVIENGARLATVRSRVRGREVVSFIGRPHPQKGFHLFERLVDDLAGSGIAFAANTVSIPSAIAIAGVELSHRLTDAELLRFFAATDLLVAPYLRADGLPLAVLEALNCGVPVIGFDVPGLGTLLRRHGQIVLEPRYEALLAAVRAWRDGRLLVAAPPAGQVRPWHKQADRYLALFDEVLGQAPPRHSSPAGGPSGVRSGA